MHEVNTHCGCIPFHTTPNTLALRSLPTSQPAKMTHPDGVNTVEGRLATFDTQHPAKRRASSNRKRAAAQLKWPHESPSPEDVCTYAARLGYTLIISTTACKSRIFLCSVCFESRQHTMLLLRSPSRWLGGG
jgi:hypothetical protein